LWRRPRPKLGCGAKERRRRTWVGGWGLTYSGTGYSPVAGSSEHSNKTSVVIKSGKSLVQLRDYWYSENKVSTLFHGVVDVWKEEE
jgi:hypothetical protein